MVTIGMNYRVIARKEDIFEHAFNNVVRAMEKIEGHGETHMFRDINSPQHYLIVSQWDSKPAFDAFIASDTFNNVATWGKEHILSDRPRHEVYEAPTPTSCGSDFEVAQAPIAATCPVGIH